MSLWALKYDLLYSPHSPVISPFTAFSLLLMSGGRLALRHLTAFPMLLTMSWLGITIGGNISSILVQWMFPTLITDTFPHLVPTSIMTSGGLIIFCCYELLVILRKTPQQAFILDDILLHLALVPGGMSLLGHALGNPYYISSNYDPRVGINLLEMIFMAAFALSSALNNHELFLWSFLKEKLSNRLIFITLFINQYMAPVVVAWLINSQGPGAGLELFIMLGGVFATLMFLSINSYLAYPQMADR